MENQVKYIYYNTDMTHKFGAHLSIAGGYHNALQKAQEIGGSCLQIFSASPRAWNFARPTNEAIDYFKEEKQRLKIDPVYFHASYLINLADEGRVGQLSKNLLVHELKLASQLGIRGTIVHLGSYKEIQTESKYNTLIKNIASILEKTPKNTLFIIENAGNKKICQRLEEIAQIIKDLRDDRVRVCLDTCHLFACGYDIATKEKFDGFFSKFNSLIGLEKLELFQVNDSKDPFGSGRDRHENIGEGTIPTTTFQLLLNDSRTKKLPFIIETPGFDKKGPDKKNLDILKSLTLYKV